MRDSIGQAKAMVMSMLAVLVGAVLLTICIATSHAAAQEVDVELGPEQHRYVTQGQLVSYRLVLTNTGTSVDEYSIEVLSMQGWPTALQTQIGPMSGISFVLEANPQVTVSFQVSQVVPQGAIGTTEVTIITATSQTDPTVIATARNTATVSAVAYLPLVAFRLPPYQPSLAACRRDNPESALCLARLCLRPTSCMVDKIEPIEKAPVGGN